MKELLMDMKVHPEFYLLFLGLWGFGATIVLMFTGAELDRIRGKIRELEKR